VSEVRHAPYVYDQHRADHKRAWGPGIVLASVADDAGIINAAFYTTLVITAVVTSQMAGAWLRFVLSKGWPLLSTNPDETWKLRETEPGPALPHGTEGFPV